MCGINNFFKNVQHPPKLPSRRCSLKPVYEHDKDAGLGGPLKLVDIRYDCSDKHLFIRRTVEYRGQETFDFDLKTPTLFSDSAALKAALKAKLVMGKKKPINSKPTKYWPAKVAPKLDGKVKIKPLPTRTPKKAKKSK